MQHSILIKIVIEMGNLKWYYFHNIQEGSEDMQ